MRPVRLRYNEHRRDALNKTANTPFGDHFQKEHTQGEVQTNSDLLNLKILYRAQGHPDRKIAESIYIRTLAPRAAESESRPELESVGVDRFAWSRSRSWSR